MGCPLQIKSIAVSEIVFMADLAIGKGLRKLRNPLKFMTEKCQVQLE